MVCHRLGRIRWEERRIFLIFSVPGPKMWRQDRQSEAGGVMEDVYFVISTGNSLSPGPPWIILSRLNLLYLSAYCSSSLNKAKVLDKIEICLCQWFKCKQIRPLLLSSYFAMDLPFDQRWLTCVQGSSWQEGQRWMEKGLSLLLKGRIQTLITVLPLTSHWLELSNRATPNSRKGWKM